MESRAPVIISAIRVAGLLLVAAWAGQSGAQETGARSDPHPLKGWWLAVDDLWPRLRNDAGTAVFENCSSSTMTGRSRTARSFSNLRARKPAHPIPGSPVATRR
jgi:hypothetical protein